MDTKPTKEQEQPSDAGDLWDTKTSAVAEAAPTVTTGGDDAEDWDTETTTVTTTAVATEEDWDSEVAEAPKPASTPSVVASTGDGGEDWDAEIEASEKLESETSTTALASDDWDAEADAGVFAVPKAPAPKKVVDQGPTIASSEDWDSEVSDWDSVCGQVSCPSEATSSVLPPSTTSAVVPSLTIASSEDWDAEGDDGGVAASTDDGCGASTVATSTSLTSAGAGAKPAAANWEEDKKRTNTVKKIRDALNFMRNQQFEVPFIAFYRKEYVEPELNINDLWKVYTWDERWCQLRTRKDNLQRLFRKMQEFQCDEIMREPDRPLPEDVRVLADEDFERLQAVQSFEELKDVYSHFDLYYGADVPKMREALRRKKLTEREQNQRRRKAAGVGEDGVDVEEEEEAVEKDDLDAVEEDRVKQATRMDAYTYCRRAHLGE